MRTIKTARPNGWCIQIVQYSGDPLFYILEYDDEGYPLDPDEGYETLADAKTEFTRLATDLASVPNWELQARYDEEHGTDNGFAPWQYNASNY